MFDLEILKAVLREGCAVLGSKGCGKTNLVFWLVDALLFHGCRVKVFDSSLAWVKRSSIPYFVRVQRIVSVPNLIYDLARLKCEDMQRFVNEVCESVFFEHVNATDSQTMVQPTIIVFEEIQTKSGKLPLLGIELLRFMES